MSDFVGKYKLGEKASDSYQSGMLGTKQTFVDADYSATDEIETLSGMPVVAIWVKNNAATALPPGSVCKWDTEGVGTLVEGLAGDSQVGAGVVDPFLSASVAQNEKFYIIVEGPTKILSNGGYSAGDLLQPVSSGKVDTNPLTDEADVASSCARAIEAATAGDQLKRALVKFTTV